MFLSKNIFPIQASHNPLVEFRKGFPFGHTHFDVFESKIVFPGHGVHWPEVLFWNGFNFGQTHLFVKRSKTVPFTHEG